MNHAVVYGSVDLTKRTTTLSDSLTLNGVEVPLMADTVDAVVGTINRFTPLTNVTASVAAAGSTEAVAKSSHPAKHLVLTSPADIRIDGDQHVLDALGLTGGLTKVSTAGGATKAST